MKLTIDVTGIDKAIQTVNGFSDRRTASVFATALTRTAQAIAAEQRKEMAQVFDRPTPWTTGSIGIKPANAADLTAEVFVKSAASGGGRSAAAYLQWQISGGSRTMKAFERLLQASKFVPSGYRVVPAIGARIDAFGNLDRTQLRQILAGLRETAQTGPQPKGFGGKRLRAARKAGGQFFVMPPGRKAPPGVYQRAFGEAREITPVLLFVRSASYAKRFDFYGIAQRTAKARFPLELDRAIGESAARLEARG